jgi:hypothetical protein
MTAQATVYGDEADTLPAGYAYIAVSSDASDHECEKPSISLGVPVNTCIAVGDYGYKVQIVEGESRGRHDSIVYCLGNEPALRILICRQLPRRRRSVL